LVSQWYLMKTSPWTIHLNPMFINHMFMNYDNLNFKFKNNQNINTYQIKYIQMWTPFMHKIIKIFWQ
jgi:hypothetical protein